MRLPPRDLDVTVEILTIARHADELARDVPPVIAMLSIDHRLRHRPAHRPPKDHPLAGRRTRIPYFYGVAPGPHHRVGSIDPNNAAATASPSQLRPARAIRTMLSRCEPPITCNSPVSPGPLTRTHTGLSQPYG